MFIDIVVAASAEKSPYQLLLAEGDVLGSEDVLIEEEGDVAVGTSSGWQAVSTYMRWSYVRLEVVIVHKVRKGASDEVEKLEEVGHGF